MEMDNTPKEEGKLEQADGGEGYRLVSRAYFCYQCQQKQRKMVAVADIDSLLCDLCGGGFCEVLEAETMQEMLEQGVVQQQTKQPGPIEQIQSADEPAGGSMLSQLMAQGSSLINDQDGQQEDDAAFRPPQVSTGRREDMRDTRLRSDASGRPAGAKVNPPEEQKVPGVQQPQASAQARGRRRNPFMGGGNFMQEFFGDSSPFAGVEDSIDFSAFGGGASQSSPSAQFSQMINPGGGINISVNQQSNVPMSSNIRVSSNMGGQGQQQQQQQQQPGRGGREQIFDQFFRPFNFTSMFNNDQFGNMSEENDFNPHEFGVNYSQNFRSSMPRRRQGQGQNAGFQGAQDPRRSFFQEMRGGPAGGGARGGLGGISFEEFANLINQRMQAAAQAEEEERRRPTDPTYVQRMPEVPIEAKHCKKGDDGQVEMPACSVCMSDFEVGVKGNFLPCGHIFHPECIKPWLKDHNTCPVCRKELPT